MIRIIKIMLILLVAIWGAIGALGNLFHWALTTDAVRSVVSMAGIEGSPPQATENAIVIFLGAAFIVSGKMATAILCGVGAMRMWRARSADQEIFQKSKTWALIGCAAALAMLFGGFVVVADTLFLMWQTPEGQMAGAMAFRYGGFIALIMLITAQRE